MTLPLIAVIGAGLIGRRHIEQAIAQAELCAIIDPSNDAAALAAEVGAPHFSDLAECLAQLRPDGAVVATPNHLHSEHAVLCLNAGVPLLIEKPIADRLGAADVITQTAARTGVPVLIGHHRRHNPIVRRAKTVIDDGELGEIVAIHGQFWLYKPDEYFQSAWRKRAGAGPTLINLIHDIDLMRYFCGEIIEISSMRANRQRNQAVEDTAAVILRFANGALGSFSLSDTIAAPLSWEMTSAENPIYPHRPGSCYTVGGTLGSLSIPDMKLWSYDGPRSWWHPIDENSLDVRPDDAFALQFSHFLDVIQGARPVVDAAEGRASLAAVLAVLEAPLAGRKAP
ncbi:MAG: Gfo/Idh/MocA family oxidoreductase [Pseudomonadota bacterium]